MGFGGGLSEGVHTESSGRCPQRASTYVLAVTGRFLPSRVRRRVRASQTGVREAPAGGSQKEPQEFEATLRAGELRVGTPKGSAAPPLGGRFPGGRILMMAPDR